MRAIDPLAPTPPAATLGLQPLRVVLADDDPHFLEMLQTVLAAEERIEVVGVARNGEEAVMLVDARAPDVILMDVHMPVLDGLAAARRIHELGGSHLVVILSGTAEPDADVLVEVGAAAYVKKSVELLELVGVIFALAAAASMSHLGPGRLPDD